MNTDNPEPDCSPEALSRRRFFTRLSILSGALCSAILAVPAIGFVLGPLLEKTPQLWRTVGKVTDFEIGKTVSVVVEDSSPLPWAGVTAKTGAWLRRVSENEFMAFAVNCSHLGCPVRWMQDANLFMCPCHGGVYYSDGRVAAGPPPRPLTQYTVRVYHGEVQVRTRPIPLS
jgi:menaquinol-cytochrome c reductase iron-sulfur subunit